MLQESDIIPYHLSHPPGERAIVLAPHPDDETLGCGGTIRLLLKSKRAVKVIFLTSGDKADPSHPASDIKHREEYGTDYSLMREKEAVRALKVLGVSDYEFLRFPDRELEIYYKDALESLLEIVRTYMPDTIYSPSMIELNPDHRTTAALSLEIQRIVMNTDINTLIHDVPPPLPPPQGGRVRVGVMPISLVFYEVTTPLRPNMLIDITAAYTRKKRAIKKYKSQLKIRDYLKHIIALNTFRSLTVDGLSHVEAFWCVDKPLSGEDIAKWLSYF